MAHKRRHEETSMKDLGKTITAEPFTWFLIALAIFGTLAMILN
jgi:ABC-type arginine transport system permease subunit